MFEFQIFPEEVLKTEAAAYPCGICPPEAPCHKELPPGTDLPDAGFDGFGY